MLLSNAMLWMFDNLESWSPTAPLHVSHDVDNSLSYLNQYI